MARNKLLLSAVFGPYGVKDEFGEDLGTQMELMNNQITRGQGIHSPRQAYWSFGLYLMAENLSVQTTVLDFPNWEEFVAELKKGYTHVGISFIVPNVLKARRMAEHIRAEHPEVKIILGGYGTCIPNLDQVVPHDEVCPGEGVRWLRDYFGDDVEAPITHPVLIGPAYESIYGFSGKPRGGILLPGLGCENGCSFCVTSHKFNKCYVPLLETGQQLFDACRAAEDKHGTTGFSVMDENFLKHPARARELLRLMEENGKPYVFDLFSSAETIAKLGTDFLQRLGVHLVWIGVESKSNGHDKTRGIDLKALIAELQSKGIVVQASTILFQDHHDGQSIWEDIDWTIGLKSDLVQFMNYTPFPGTGLYQRLQNEGRLKDVHMRHQHGQGQLFFDHPHFTDPQDHVEILKAAFQKKFEEQGPGVLNMAITAVEGYSRARRERAQRLRQGLHWNADTLRYEETGSPGGDPFMELRLRKMQRIAMNLRPILKAARTFAPNPKAARKARQTMARYDQVLGKQSVKDHLRSNGLVLTGAYESARLAWHRSRGHECIVRQPPSRRAEYPEDPTLKKNLGVPWLALPNQSGLPAGAPGLPAEGGPFAVAPSDLGADPATPEAWGSR